MRKVKKKDYENLSEANIEKVIALLNPEDGSKAITKKDACEILNISYNTTRLNKILEDHAEQKEYVKTRKAQNRGKAASDLEIAEAVKLYLQGDSVSEIAKLLFRSSTFVKNIIDRAGVPSRPKTAEERKEIAYLPEECVAESFEVGEVVWSARHHTAAIIEREISVNYQAEKSGFLDVNYEDRYGSKCYSIYVLEDIDQDKEFWVGGLEVGGYSAFALAYDLGKLKHLEKYGVDLSKI